MCLGDKLGQEVMEKEDVAAQVAAGVVDLVVPSFAMMAQEAAAAVAAAAVKEELVVQVVAAAGVRLPCMLSITVQVGRS